MTSSRRVLILFAAAVLAVAAGVWLTARQTSSSTPERALLYPDLKQQLDAVQSVRIYKAGDAPVVEIARKDAAWGVVQRGG